MLSKSRCLLSLSAAGSIALASHATVLAQDDVPTTGAQPAPVAAPPPAPAPGETTSTTTTQQTSETPAPKANTSTNVNVYPSSPTNTSQPSSYVDTAADYTYPNRRMLGTGAALLTLSYLPSVIVAAAGDFREDDNLYIPIAGPWLYMSRQDHDAGSKALLAIDGVLQDFGALQMLTSFVVPQREKHRHWYALGNKDRDFRILPTVSPYRAGLSAGGRF
jgi:hypothetical protein